VEQGALPSQLDGSCQSPTPALPPQLHPDALPHARKCAAAAAAPGNLVGCCSMCSSLSSVPVQAAPLSQRCFLECSAHHPSTSMCPAMLSGKLKQGLAGAPQSSPWMSFAMSLASPHCHAQKAATAASAEIPHCVSKRSGHQGAAAHQGVHGDEHGGQQQLTLQELIHTVQACGTGSTAADGQFGTVALELVGGGLSHCSRGSVALHGQGTVSGSSNLSRGTPPPCGQLSPPLLLPVQLAQQHLAPTSRSGAKIDDMCNLHKQTKFCINLQQLEGWPSAAASLPGQQVSGATPAGCGERWPTVADGLAGREEMAGCMLLDGSR